MNLYIRDDSGKRAKYRPATKDEALAEIRAKAFAAIRDAVIQDPQTARDVMRELLADGMGPADRELFAVAFLDVRHRLIGFDTLFSGTLDSAPVYPREVVKAALTRNAAAVLFAHNHPSGDSEPSQADRVLTTRLRDALALVEVRVLDHLVVGADEVTSFAERGWI
ncbi:MAG: DNA repair protein RadC [Gammaproteobacteria bacterium]